MSNQYVAEVRCVAFNFAPSGWAECDGQLMPISQNTALFSLLGTQFGGDGKSTFGLPNLQGNVAINFGQGPGLTARDIGETGGTTTVTLNTQEMPQHLHTYMSNLGDGPADAPEPNNGAFSNGPHVYTTATTPLIPMAGSALTIYGGGQPHNNMMQYLVLNFVIALQGIFPPRT